MRGQGHWGLLTGIILVLIVVVIGTLLMTTVSGFDVTKYFELQPTLGQSGTTSSSTVTTTTSADDSQATRIFTTTSESNDLSEIACLVGDEIFTDFSNNGDTVSTRTPATGTTMTTLDKKGYIPFESATGTLLEAGIFTYKTGASASEADETTISTTHPGCHLCRYSSGTGYTGITNLDETCINMQLKDRTTTESAGSKSFCTEAIHPASLLPNTGTTATFGNDDCGSISNPDSWSSNCGTFCGNGQDKLWWFSTYDDGSWGNAKWEVRYDGSSSFKYNSHALSNGWKYVYGLFWMGSSAKRYDIVFSMIPSDPTSHIATNFNDLGNIFKATTSQGGIFGFAKIDVMGKIFTEAREVADYYVTTSSPIHIDSITGDTGSGIIYNAAKGYITGTGTIYVGLDSPSQVTCNTCTGDDCIRGETTKNPISTRTGGELCTGEGWPTSDSDVDEQIAGDFLEETNIAVFTNATGITSCAGDLPAGTYRVIAQDWIGVRRYGTSWEGISTGMEQCYNNYVRSVAILQVPGVPSSSSTTTITDTFIVSPSGSGVMTVNDVPVSTSPVTKTFSLGDTVTLTATAGSGHTFSHFGNDALGISYTTNPAIFTAQYSGTIYAYFS